MSSGFVCLECGHKFKTVRAAERASDRGCPNCGGVDVDTDTGEMSRREKMRRTQEETEETAETSSDEVLKQLLGTVVMVF